MPRAEKEPQPNRACGKKGIGSQQQHPGAHQQLKTKPSWSKAHRNYQASRLRFTAVFNVGLQRYERLQPEVLQVLTRHSATPTELHQLQQMKSCPQEAASQKEKQETPRLRESYGCSPSRSLLSNGSETVILIIPQQKLQRKVSGVVPR
ncbi:UNVERIFIED_CONTAM: hypothetical protein K2H54_055401 [Gekko kuhli]